MSYFSEHYKNSRTWGVDLFYWRYFMAGVKGKILDVGCSTGRFLKIAKEFGQDIAGIDIDEDALAVARENGLPAVYGDIQGRTLFADGNFAAVHFHAVIEHLQNPLAALKECRRLLSNGGKLVCLTLDVEVCKEKFWSIDYTHVRPFSKPSLAQIAVDAGFSKIEVVNKNKYVTMSKRLPPEYFFVVNRIAYGCGWKNRKEIVLVAYK